MDDAQSAASHVEERPTCEWKVQEQTNRTMRVERGIGGRRWGRATRTCGCGRREEGAWDEGRKKRNLGAKIDFLWNHTSRNRPT